MWKYSSRTILIPSEGTKGLFVIVRLFCTITDYKGLHVIFTLMTHLVHYENTPNNKPHPEIIFFFNTNLANGIEN